MHPLEKALVTLVGIHLSFLPWALGTMHVWSQTISFVLALAALIVALWPRNYTSDYAREGTFRLLMWPRFVRFPLTWIGLLLLAYVATQALNPAWRYLRFPNGAWTMGPLVAVTWLPQGMETPFAVMSPWRMLMIYASAWLVMCALWVGITRRFALQALMTFVLVNGTVLATVGLLNKLTGSAQMLWGLIPREGYFFATIIYKNHAGAYFNLLFTAACAAFFYCFARQTRRMERSNPGPFFALCALVFAFAVLLTYSRAAALLMGGFLLFAIVALGCQLFIARERVQNRWVMGAMALIFVFFVSLAAQALNLKASTDRVSTLWNYKTDYSVTSRQQVLQAGIDMASQNLVTGWGAGGFRFRFPSFQQRYPEIWEQGGRRLFWEHAHNDYIQTLVELGIVGSALIVLGLGYGLAKFTRHRGWLRLHTFALLLGLAVTLAHGWMDFPFQNPAILLTWCALGVIVLRWLELEDK